MNSVENLWESHGIPIFGGINFATNTPGPPGGHLRHLCDEQARRFEVVVQHGPVQWGGTVLLVGFVLVSPRLQQKPYHFSPIILNRQMQRSSAIIPCLPLVDQGPPLDQETNHIHIATDGPTVQRRATLATAQVCLGAGGHQHAHNDGVPAPGGQV